MGRRTSSGQVGLEKIGAVQASETTLTTSQTNADLTLDPNGTGGVLINGDITVLNQGDLRLREATGNGTNYIAMQAASSMAANYTITWPAAVAGSSGFVLSSDTSGNLSWVAQTAAGIVGSDPGSVATVHYPFFGTSAGSIPTGAQTSFNVRSNLSFIPSTGELTATAMLAANMYGSSSNSGTLTLRGTSAATKATASVLMTDNVASTTTGTGTLVVTGGVGVSGQVTCGTLSATTITETSSIALKENLNPINNALDAIVNLQAFTYDRKDGSSKNEAGLIAEDLYKVLPNLVKLDAQGNPESILYSKITAYLVEAVKTLKKEIDSLKGN